MQLVEQQRSTITSKQQLRAGRPGIWIVAQTMFVPEGKILPGGTEYVTVGGAEGLQRLVAMTLYQTCAPHTPSQGA